MACEETWYGMSMVWLSVNLICCVNVNVKTTKWAKVDDKALLVKLDENQYLRFLQFQTFRLEKFNVQTMLAVAFDWE